MIQLSEAQYRRLRSTQEKPAKAPRFRLTEPKLRLNENEVEQAICDFLRYRGWHVYRNNVGLFRRLNSEGKVRVGEKGMADWFAVRSIGKNWPGYCEFLWLEVKANGKKPTLEQREWLARKRREGYQAEWFDSLDKFAQFYREKYDKAQ